MKANEFVKLVGIVEAKMVVNNSPKWAAIYCSEFKDYGDDEWNNAIDVDSSVDIEDLKRLVESHELVEIYTRRFNGDAEWFFVSEYCKKNRISPFFSENYNKASGIYKQAIADVESCQ